MSGDYGSERRSTALQWMVPGLAGGMMFAMLAMIVGIWTSAFWAPPQGIAQAIGIGPNGHDFHIVPFILGLMGHMMNSVILGAIFVAMARATKMGPMMLVVAGTVWGLVVYGILYYLLLPDVFSLWASAGVQSFVSTVPTWTWVVAHLLFGMTLGGALAYGPFRLRTGQPHGARPQAALQ
ncbi:MAG: hypothetical protein ACRDZT_07480 [Acidimicrobiales bacterium]